MEFEFTRYFTLPELQKNLRIQYIFLICQIFAFIPLLSLCFNFTPDELIYWRFSKTGEFLMLVFNAAYVVWQISNIRKTKAQIVKKNDPSRDVYMDDMAP